VVSFSYAVPVVFNTSQTAHGGCAGPCGPACGCRGRVGVPRAAHAPRPSDLPVSPSPQPEPPAVRGGNADAGRVAGALRRPGGKTEGRVAGALRRVAGALRRRRSLPEPSTLARGCGHAQHSTCDFRGAVGASYKLLTTSGSKCAHGAATCRPGGRVRGGEKALVARSVMGSRGRTPVVSNEKETR